MDLVFADRGKQPAALPFFSPENDSPDLTEGVRLEQSGSIGELRRLPGVLWQIGRSVEAGPPSRVEGRAAGAMVTEAARGGVQVFPLDRADIRGEKWISVGRNGRRAVSPISSKIC